ncbi:MAG: hypothetical protein SFU56_16320 [Capsulimonadales bacterium]|nr:hypothetical protein [Capsulimonadales bacterium]
MRSSPSSPASPSGRRPLLWALLGVAALAYLLSLPWQRQQWENTRKIREENALQEARIREIRSQQESVRTAETQMATGGGDINTQLSGIRAVLSRGDTVRAGKLLTEIERTAFGTPGAAPNGPLAAALAGLFQDAGWIDRALVNAQRAHDTDPNNIEFLLRLGVIEAQIAWQKECRAHIETARRAAPTAAEPRIALALLCDQVGALKEGEQELLAADRLRPDDENILRLLFRNRMSQREYAAALETAEKGLRRFPTSTGFLAGRAEALIEQALSIPGKPDTARLRTALEAAQKYRRLAPDSMEARFFLGRIHQGLGDDENARREWEIVFASREKNAALAINLGRLLVRNGERERGRQLIEAGEKQRAEGTDYNRLLITAGMMRNDAEKQREFARWCQTRRRYSHAIFGWDQVLKVRPDDVEARRERETCVRRRVDG